MSDTIKLKACPKCHAPIPAEAPEGLCPKCVLAGAAHPTDTGIPATATGEIPTIERISAAFPQLEILELIGRGAMGFVFKARQPNLDRYVALKLLPDKLAKDPHFAERFNREGRFLAKLNHPNIVSIFDFGQAGGFYFLLMEYVDGVNLRQAMRAGKFSPTEALSIVPKICEALQYAHEQGVLHRDIKPENILLDAKGRVKIADFGIAKLVGEDAPLFSLTGTGAALGTPHYMAPEQLKSPGDVDQRADIYSLGVVFYEMLTGELPIGRFAPPSARTPLDERVDDIVMRALERERELRQNTAGEMKTQVERVTNEPLPIDARRSSDQGRSAGFSRKAIWSAVLVGLSLLPGLPVLFVSLRYARSQAGGIGGWAIVLMLIAIAFSVSAIAGTVLGWAAVSDIRSRKLRGAAPAVFGALAWPALVLGGATLVVPYLLIGAAGPINDFAGWFALLMPAATLTFVIWAIYATTRWVRNEPHTVQQRGMLKWIFLGLVIAALGYATLLTSQRSLREATIAEPQPAVVASEQAPSFGPVVERVLSEPAAGVASLLNFETGELVTPPGALAEKLKVGRADIGEEAVRWLRESGVDAVVNMPNAGSLRLFEGVAVSFARNQNPALRWDQFTPADVEAALGQAGWERNRRFVKSDQTFYATPALAPDALAFITREGSMGVLEIAGITATPPGVKIRYKLVNRSDNATNTAPWIGFTFTSVELREAAGVRWLTIDYLDDVHGDVDKSFVRQSTIPGFNGESRTSEFLKDNPGSAPVRHQRVEFRLPDSIERSELEKLRDDVNRALNTKSIRLGLGEEKLLFEFPAPEGGSLKTSIKVVPPLNQKGVPQTASTVAPGPRKELMQTFTQIRFPARQQLIVHTTIWKHGVAEPGPQIVIDNPSVVNASQPVALAAALNRMTKPGEFPKPSNEPLEMSLTMLLQRGAQLSSGNVLFQLPRLTNQSMAFINTSPAQLTLRSGMRTNVWLWQGQPGLTLSNAPTQNTPAYSINAVAHMRVTNPLPLSNIIWGIQAELSLQDLPGKANDQP